MTDGDKELDQVRTQVSYIPRLAGNAVTHNGPCTDGPWRKEDAVGGHMFAPAPPSTLDQMSLTFRLTVVGSTELSFKVAVSRAKARGAKTMWRRANGMEGAIYSANWQATQSACALVDLTNYIQCRYCGLCGVWTGLTMPNKA